MKNIFFLLFMSLPLFAGDVSGVWKIDKEETEEFNSKYSVQEELEKALFSCMNETIEFRNGKFQASTNDYACSFNGKSTIVKGHNIRAKYKVIGKTPDSVVVELISEDKAKSYGQYYFIAPDLMWLYIGGSGELGSSNIRWYYRKQK